MRKVLLVSTVSLPSSGFMWEARETFLCCFKRCFEERKLSRLIQFLDQEDNLVEGRESCGRLGKQIEARKHCFLNTFNLSDTYLDTHSWKGFLWTRSSIFFKELSKQKVSNQKHINSNFRVINLRRHCFQRFLLVTFCLPKFFGRLSAKGKREAQKKFNLCRWEKSSSENKCSRKLAARVKSLAQIGLYLHRFFGKLHQYFSHQFALLRIQKQRRIWDRRRSLTDTNKLLTVSNS